ncbi:hypothetical protein GALMADRAFT_218878 [Galerina marginata CBS 339.88]|uniref:Uncharacterized protein n=1 Tax=Galerina marginata (strain CBS 339.88) TaxID=685588 RepID=A0A067TRG6_GALM3|nr:hypothetical protein GALMADRAFT_218878 [Galerina marginata CBS 339.88]
MTERVKQDHGKVQSYMPVPNSFDFELVDESGLHNKKTNGYIKNITHLVESGGGIDLLILGYCEYDMQYSWWSPPLLEAWDAWDAVHKFDIACIVHSVPTVRGWIRETAEWNRRNAIRMFPILQHYGRDFRTVFDGLSRAQPVDSSQEPVLSKSRGFEYIPHRPTLDPPKPAERPPDRVFSNAVIIGSFDRKQRDYSRLFIDFITSLHTDPTQWGYLPPKTGRSFILDTSAEHPPFRLHLI